MNRKLRRKIQGVSLSAKKRADGHLFHRIRFVRLLTAQSTVENNSFISVRVKSRLSVYESVVSGMADPSLAWFMQRLYHGGAKNAIPKKKFFSNEFHSCPLPCQFY